MDDFSFWWYIIAAVIYFLTRNKKKPQASRPGTENTPPPSQRPKSFEELLREITEGPQAETAYEEPKQVPVVIEEPKTEEAFKYEGERRVFADDESRRVYEESIKMAEGADLKFEKEEHFQTPTLFKGLAVTDNESDESAADLLVADFDTEEARKAFIYSEILNRKY